MAERVEIMNKTSDFAIKVIILVTTLVTLSYFMSIYNRILFGTLVLLMLMAMIIKGVTDFMLVRKK